MGECEKRKAEKREKEASVTDSQPAPEETDSDSVATPSQPDPSGRGLPPNPGLMGKGGERQDLKPSEENPSDDGRK